MRNVDQLKETLHMCKKDELLMDFEVVRMANEIIIIFVMQNSLDNPELIIDPDEGTVISAFPFDIQLSKVDAEAVTHRIRKSYAGWQTRVTPIDCETDAVEIYFLQNFLTSEAWASRLKQALITYRDTVVTIKEILDTKEEI